MADSEDTKAEASAEKAYAAAAEAVSDSPSEKTVLDTTASDKADVVAETAKPAETAPVAVAPVAEAIAFPAKPKRVAKPRETVAPAPVADVAPVVAAPAPVAAKLKASRPRTAAKSAIKPAIKPVAAKPTAAAAKAAPAKLRKPAAAKIKAAAKPAPKPIKTAAKPAAPKLAEAGTAAPKLPFIAQLKEIPMDVTSTIKDAVNGAQAKAKDAFAKTSAAATEYTDFAKGNVEAFVESGKILASGLQDIGGKFIADSKTALDTATADVKALTSVKSPTDFFQMQVELLRRNIDSAVSYSSKTSEAMLKLTNDVIAPISGRVNLAVEKIQKAA